MWHMTDFQLFWLSHYGFHMWGRKWSLFPEHLILFITEFGSLENMLTK